MLDGKDKVVDIVTETISEETLLAVPASTKAIPLKLEVDESIVDYRVLVDALDLPLNEESSLGVTSSLTSVTKASDGKSDLVSSWLVVSKYLTR